MTPLDHARHPGWVAIWCDTELLRRLREHQTADESVHDVVRRLLLAGLVAGAG